MTPADDEATEGPTACQGSGSLSSKSLSWGLASICEWEVFQEIAPLCCRHEALGDWRDWRDWVDVHQKKEGNRTGFLVHVKRPC